MTDLTSLSNPEIDLLLARLQGKEAKLVGQRCFLDGKGPYNPRADTYSPTTDWRDTAVFIPGLYWFDVPHKDHPGGVTEKYGAGYLDGTGAHAFTHKDPKVAICLAAAAKMLEEQGKTVEEILNAD